MGSVVEVLMFRATGTVTGLPPPTGVRVIEAEYEPGDNVATAEVTETDKRVPVVPGGTKAVESQFTPGGLLTCTATLTGALASMD
jgi:hypothetical protein